MQSRAFIGVPPVYTGVIFLFSWIYLLFLRQIGMSDGKIEACIEDGKEIFDRLPIDNRYYVDFRYDDRYVAKLPGVKE